MPFSQCCEIIQIKASGKLCKKGLFVQLAEYRHLIDEASNVLSPMSKNGLRSIKVYDFVRS